MNRILGNCQVTDHNPSMITPTRFATVRQFAEANAGRGRIVAPTLVWPELANNSEALVSAGLKVTIHNRETRECTIRRTKGNPS